MLCLKSREILDDIREDALKLFHICHHLPRATSTLTSITNINFHCVYVDYYFGEKAKKKRFDSGIRANREARHTTNGNLHFIPTRRQRKNQCQADYAVLPVVLFVLSDKGPALFYTNNVCRVDKQKTSSGNQSPTGTQLHIIVSEHTSLYNFK